jgi:redox-sensitive bicupin YhaK (pirin superfamily)
MPSLTQSSPTEPHNTISVRKSKERGYNEAPGMRSYYTFSFGKYYDYRFESFGKLRLLNEDVIQPLSGVDMHPHRNQEILTYVIFGEIEHEDCMGNIDVLKRGDVQLISAGTGIHHAERNKSTIWPAHLLQIWVCPDEKDLAPKYQMKKFSDLEKLNRLCQIVSPVKTLPEEHKTNTVHVNQDFSCYSCLLQSGKKVSYSLLAGRKVYIHVINKNNRNHLLNIRVVAECGEEWCQTLEDGDGLFIELMGNGIINLEATYSKTIVPIEFLLFDTIAGEIFNPLISETQCSQQDE